MRAVTATQGLRVHYTKTAVLAFLIIALSQLIGRDADTTAILDSLRRSACLVFFWLVLQIAPAEVAIRHYADRMGILGAAAAGVSAGAIPAGILSLANTTVLPQLDDTAAYLGAHIWFVLLHLILGWLLGLILCLSRWQALSKAPLFPVSKSCPAHFPAKLQTSSASLPVSISRRVAGRLDIDPSQELLCLSAEGHHVRVRTNQSNYLVPMRFADALSQVEQYDGTQIHRSHWVARRGVAFAEKHKGRWFVELTDGTQLPISRRHWAAASRFL